eukprot:3240081-Alexandrium_andersonii.AAC.1
MLQFAVVGRRYAKVEGRGRPRRPTWTPQPTTWSTTAPPWASGRPMSARDPARWALASTSGRSV